MSSKKVCFVGLRWISNYMIESQRIPRLSTKELLKKVDEKDRHTGSTLAWTRQQAEIIEKIGMEEWLKTDGALGYGHWFDKKLK